NSDTPKSFKYYWEEMHVLENSNTSFCKISKVLIDQAENRVNKKKYEDLVRRVPLATNNVTIFLKIKKNITHYLCPNIVQYLVSQMKECIYYTAFCSNIEEVENTSASELSGNEFFENELDNILSFISENYQEYVNDDLVDQQLFYEKVWEELNKIHQVDMSEKNEDLNKENICLNVQFKNLIVVTTK
ncbi:6428_t:CDS:2, partial [Racocetra persica]